CAREYSNYVMDYW
nr:immunoglobulin heavy chain junction region [Mus musculus]